MNLTSNTTEIPVANDTRSSVEDCNLFPDNPDFCLTLVLTKRVAISMAMFGSLVTLVIIVFFKKYKEFSQRLIANLSLASFMLAAAGWITDINKSPTTVCVIQGAIIMYSVVAICLWIMTIMVNLYKLVVYNSSFQSSEKVLTFGCWFVPVIFAGIPFAGNDVYGPAGAWCWFVNKWEWIFGAWYFWRILSVIAIFVLTLRIIFLLRKAARTGRTEESNFHALKEDILTLRVYPVAYFILNIIQIIDRSYQSIHGQHSQRFVFPLTLMHCIIGFSYGTALCLIFVLDKRTLSLLTIENIRKTFTQKWMKSKTIFEYPVHGVSNTVTAEEETPTERQQRNA